MSKFWDVRQLTKAQLKAFLTRHEFIAILLAPAIQLRRRWRQRRDRAFQEFYSALFKNVEQGSLVVRLDELHGTFEIDVRSHLLRTISKDNRFEHEVVTMLKSHLDSTRDIVDIGANIGLFTVFFAKHVGADRRVLAIEPSSGALSYLRRNLVRNGVQEKVILWEGVAASKTGEYKIHTIKGREEYSSMASIIHPAVIGQPTQSFIVPGVPLDNLVAQYSLAPGLIKIDTEGAEYQVLCGAVHTLEKYRPVILTELSDMLLANFGASTRQVVQLLRNYGYEVIDCQAPGSPITYPFEGYVIALPMPLFPIG